MNKFLQYFLILSVIFLISNDCYGQEPLMNEMSQESQLRELLNETLMYEGVHVTKNNKSIPYQIFGMNNVIFMHDAILPIAKKLFEKMVILFDFPRKKSFNQTKTLFEEFQQDQRIKDMNLTFAFCNPKVCQSLLYTSFISQYPSLLLLEKGKFVQKLYLRNFLNMYGTVKDIMVSKFMKMPIKYETSAQFTKLMKISRCTSVFYSKSPQGQMYDAFMNLSASNLIKEQINFAMVSDLSIINQKLIPVDFQNQVMAENSIMIFKKFDNNFDILNDFSDLNTTHMFIKNSCQQQLFNSQDLDHQSNYNQLMAKDQMVLFYNSTNPEQAEKTKEAIEVFQKIAMKRLEKYLFLKIDVDNDDNREVFQTFDMSLYLDKLPQVRLAAHIRQKQQDEVSPEFQNYRFNETITENNLLNFMQKYENKEIENLKQQFNFQLDHQKNKDNNEFMMDDQRFVRELNSKNFKRWIYNKNQSMVFVQFYTNWCSPCHQMAANWDKLGFQFQGMNNVTIAKFNADRSNPAKAFYVDKYPSFVLFVQGSEPKVYNGDMTFKNFKNFMIQNGAMDPEPEDQNDVEFQQSEQTENEDYEVDSSVPNINPETFDEFINSNDYTMVMFYAPWCDHCKKFKLFYNLLGALFRDIQTVNIVKFNADLYETKDIANVTHYPTFYLFKKGQKEGIPYNEPQDLKKLIDFINSHTSQKLEISESEIRKFEEIIYNTMNFEEQQEIDQSSGLQGVVYETKELNQLDDQAMEKAMNSDMNILLKVFAPWSINSKRLAPIFDKLTQMFEKTQNIMVAGLNAEFYPQLLQKYKLKLEIFPTIFYIPSGQRENYKEMAGFQEEKQILDFLKQNGIDIDNLEMPAGEQKADL